MDSKAKFAASLKDVFEVKRQQPPPPPSSRRPHPVSSTPPPPPSARPSAAPNGGTAEPSKSRAAPDSLIPVRFADLLHEESVKAGVAKRSPSRTKFPVLGAFIAGAVVMLGVQMLLTRTNHERAAAPPLTRPPAVAGPEPRAQGEVPKPPAAEVTPVSSAVAIAAPDPAATAMVESVPTIVPVPSPSAAPPPSADAVVSTNDSQSGPVHHHRKRRNSSTGYDIPTAEFPDPGK